jgi:DNA invertase Pin-like site-specific DNA recombinase
LSGASSIWSVDRLVDRDKSWSGFSANYTARESISIQRMGVFAEFERAMIVERVKSGLSRARAQGKRLGLPSIASAKEDAVRRALVSSKRRRWSVWA